MKGLIAGALVLPLVLAFGIIGLVLVTASQDCATLTVGVTPASAPDPLTIYTGEQRENALAVVSAGAIAGVNARAQTIALMAAIKQTDLVAIEHDPLSTMAAYAGIYQASDNLTWGTQADRMDPSVASTTFYRLLLAVPGWETMDLAAAAQAVLPTDDPIGYSSSYGSAVGILTALNTTPVRCQAGSPGAVNDQGWALPAGGTISGGFGPRTPVCNTYGCSSNFHTGTDLQNPLDTPIYAAYGGEVIQAGSNGTFGYSVTIDHGNGATTFYGHMDAGDVFVKVGDDVYAGQNIAQVGCSGTCSGPHLHFEVRVRGTAVDPVPFMQLVGIQLGR